MENAPCVKGIPIHQKQKFLLKYYVQTRYTKKYIESLSKLGKLDCKFSHTGIIATATWFEILFFYSEAANASVGDIWLLFKDKDC